MVDGGSGREEERSELGAGVAVVAGEAIEDTISVTELFQCATAIVPGVTTEWSRLLSSRSPAEVFSEAAVSSILRTNAAIRVV